MLKLKKQQRTRNYWHLVDNEYYQQLHTRQTFPLIGSSHKTSLNFDLRAKKIYNLEENSVYITLWPANEDNKNREKKCVQ